MNKLANDMKRKKNDVVYTPISIALKMIELCEITENMKVLDPCRGKGVFFNNLPVCDKHYCEITEDIDFFNETKHYDLIIGNPPFSIWNKWLEHTMKITDKFCYIFNTLNLSIRRLGLIQKGGFSVTKMHYSTISWWFGSQVICIFERNKPSIITFDEKTVLCDICNSRCNRGEKGFSMNQCSKIL